MAAGDGLVSMKPTSIAHSGTSASINADGGVDFTAVTELSLNGVFTSEMDNYLIVMSHIGSANENIPLRLRVSGVDASGSDYTRQALAAISTSVLGQRDTSQSAIVVGRVSASRGGEQIHVYGPSLAQPTAFRNVNVNGVSGAAIEADNAGTHSLSTAYDGFSFVLAADNMTGTVHVFGYEE
jgi:hypothetical protein